MGSVALTAAPIRTRRRARCPCRRRPRCAAERRLLVARQFRRRELVRSRRRHDKTHLARSEFDHARLAAGRRRSRRRMPAVGIVSATSPAFRRKTIAQARSSRTVCSVIPVERVEFAWTTARSRPHESQSSIGTGCGAHDVAVEAGVSKRAGSSSTWDARSGSASVPGNFGRAQILAGDGVEHAQAQLDRRSDHELEIVASPRRGDRPATVMFGGAPTPSGGGRPAGPSRSNGRHQSLGASMLRVMAADVDSAASCPLAGVSIRCRIRRKGRAVPGPVDEHRTRAACRNELWRRDEFEFHVSTAPRRERSPRSRPTRSGFRRSSPAPQPRPRHQEEDRSSSNCSRAPSSNSSNGRTCPASRKRSRAALGRSVRSANLERQRAAAAQHDLALTTDEQVDRRKPHSCPSTPTSTRNSSHSDSWPMYGSSSIGDASPDATRRSAKSSPGCVSPSSGYCCVRTRVTPASSAPDSASSTRRRGGVGRSKRTTNSNDSGARLSRPAIRSARTAFPLARRTPRPWSLGPRTPAQPPSVPVRTERPATGPRPRCRARAGKFRSAPEARDRVRRRPRRCRATNGSTRSVSVKALAPRTRSRSRCAIPGPSSALPFVPALRAFPQPVVLRHLRARRHFRRPGRRSRTKSSATRSTSPREIEASVFTLTISLPSHAGRGHARLAARGTFERQPVSGRNRAACCLGFRPMNPTSLELLATASVRAGRPCTRFP
jgi:hypothetical protein